MLSAAEKKQRRRRGGREGKREGGTEEGGRELDINQPRPAVGASVALIMDETGLILLRKRKPVIAFLRGAAYLPDLLCLKRGLGVFCFLLFFFNTKKMYTGLRGVLLH